MRALLLSLILVAGCQIQSQSSLPGTENALVAVSHPVRAWEIVQRDRVVGVVVEFDERHQGRRFYSIRNAWQQELGLVDAVGRAWRYRPHQSEADWLGSGTVVEGAARVLGLDGDAEVFEVELGSLRESDVTTLETAPD